MILVYVRSRTRYSRRWRSLQISHFIHHGRTCRGDRYPYLVILICLRKPMRVLQYIIPVLYTVVQYCTLQYCTLCRSTVLCNISTDITTPAATCQQWGLGHSPENPDTLPWCILISYRLQRLNWHLLFRLLHPTAVLRMVVTEDMDFSGQRDGLGSLFEGSAGSR